MTLRCFCDSCKIEMPPDFQLVGNVHLCRECRLAADIVKAERKLKDLKEELLKV